jgi:hypothetical protein
MLIVWSSVSCGRVAESGLKGATKAAAQKVVPFWSTATVAVENAISRQSVVWALKGEQQGLFRAIETVRPSARWRRVVWHDVKAFVRAFEEGARNPQRYLNDPTADATFVARWNATPIQDRVFVAAAKDDVRLVEALRAQLEKEGKVLFFYQFCGPSVSALCAATTVGAFFGTAGAAVVATTSASAESRFVAHEAAAGAGVLAGQRELFLLTPREMLANSSQSAGLQMVKGVVTVDEDR